MNPLNAFSRRAFLTKSVGATAALPLLGALASQAEEKPVPATAPVIITRKIKLGIIGLGRRGSWIAELFRQHGGYEIHAVADYFPTVVEAKGEALGVDKSRRFSGLSGYKKVLASGVEAVVIIDVPFFYPEQARAAVEAGLHVYIAKPIAVDVPGVLSVEASAKEATKQRRVFLVDYQLPTDPINIEVYRLIADGALGPIQTIFSTGFAGGKGFNDPPLTNTIESRFQGLIWTNDNALGCGYHGNFDIHVVDAVLRATRRKPVAATGWGGQFRPHPHGDTQDTTCLFFTFEDGMVWNHQSVIGTSDAWFLGNGALAAEIQGKDASARLSYSGKAFVRGGKQNYGGGKVENLYKAGAQRNIATFYQQVTQAQVDNVTVACGVDSALTCILGREAAIRNTKVTMEEVLKENKKLEVDLKGLTV